MVRIGMISVTGISNIADPDQTAPKEQSDLDLQYLLKYFIKTSRINMATLFVAGKKS